MARQIFDDGTWLDTDASGTVLAYSDTSGRVYGADTSIMDSFLRSVGSSLTRALDAKLNPQPAPIVTAAPAVTAFNVRGLLVVLLVAGGAFALYKAAK